MDDYRQQQMDVLKEAVPYSEKLIGAIEKVSDELAGVPFPETHDAVNVIIEGLNWLFEVYNGTKDIIEAGAVDEAEANSGVKELSEAVKADDISINPMNYVNNKIVAYKNPYKPVNDPYNLSAYSGMMFNGYI